MRGPAYFEVESSPTLQLEQSHAVIINVERLFGIDFTFAPAAFADAARAELGNRLTGDTDDVELTQQMQRGIQHMRADVEGGSTTGEFFLSEPRAGAGYSAT